jgi:hypothetical protein
MVAPLAPKKTPEPVGDGKPANICHELVAFLEQGAADPATVSPGTVPGSSAPAIDKHQHRSGLVGPVPPADTETKPPLVTPDQARALAQKNDLRACQEAVRQMRRAGVALPGGLIALAALPPEHFAENPGGR